MTTYFTGIGSRETPDEVLDQLRGLSQFFCEKGYVLRSGGADGADRICEIGCDKVDGTKEIYLPWEDFNNNFFSDLYLDVLPKVGEAIQIAADHHPKWESLTDNVKKMHVRNVYQVLGLTLDKPSKFVVCWTPVKNSVPQGGTAQAIRVAKTHNVPVYNLYEIDNPEFIKYIN